MRVSVSVLWMALCATCVCLPATASADTLELRLQFVKPSAGAGAQARQRFVKLTARDATLTREQRDAGGRDGANESVRVTLDYAPREIVPTRKLHVIWSDLIARSDADTARRLTQDPAYRHDSRAVTVQLDPDGTRGFTVTVDQLLRQRAFWIPSLNLFLTAVPPGAQPMTLDEHLASINPRQGERILDKVRVEPEATYETYTARWDDMGDARYRYHEQTQGHIIGVTWDSAIHKFGIDRGAGVWSDLGNPDQLRFWFQFADLSEGVERAWKSQRLTDGLPVIVTTLERDGLRYEVEQFAYPLNGPPAGRRGDVPMVLLQRVNVTELEGRARIVPITFTHLRKLEEASANALRFERSTLVDTSRHETLLAVQAAAASATAADAAAIEWSGVTDYQDKLSRITGTFPISIGARATQQFTVKLPSPAVAQSDRAAFDALDYDTARRGTIAFWNEWIARGAQFRTPDPAVNALVRANLWHALRLPRRHAPDATTGAVDMDLPYTNFAYGQDGAPWPVNQSVYVDYMLYDLRGYHAVSVEELASMFRGNQEANGHIKGLFNWVVYTPGMLYAAAQHYLLSGDRASFESLLPQSLKAMDWCLEQAKHGDSQPGALRGLVSGPLNDLTGEGIWAFNNAYIYASLDLFGRALAVYGHPRAAEAKAAAQAIRASIQRGFGAASVRSPLVQLRDHTWTPYVPAEADATGRLLDVWYPTDVDTGALHLVRLRALAADSPLADALLNDHEDNLFLHGWGIANEPVYNQQGTAYLLRDNAAAAIRTFYSYMASGFSHSTLEPVEHRWTHHQYFGPPSTDGAWFELFRNMLVREQDDETLLIGQAAPRAWLKDGQRIDVERAPTYYGPLSFSIASHADRGTIDASIDAPSRRAPATLLVRLRHPNGARIRSVTVNGRPWTDFDADREWIRIAHPTERHYAIVASY